MIIIQKGISKINNLPIILCLHKLASSVNLYRFTYFLELSFGPFFANLLVGVTPNPPEHHLPMMATQQSCWQYPERISVLKCCVTMVTVVTMKRRASQGQFVSSPSSQPSHFEKYNISLWENLQIWKPGLHWKYTNGGHSQHQRCCSMGFGAAAPTSSLWLWIATSIACYNMFDHKNSVALIILSAVQTWSVMKR